MFPSNISKNSITSTYNQYKNSFFKRFYLFIFRERGREREREGEKQQCVVASHVAPIGDLACNPGTCPDWDSNQQPLFQILVLNPLSHTSQGNIKFLNILFSSCTESSKSGVYFTLTAHLSLDQPHFECSASPCASSCKTGQYSFGGC